MADDSKKFEDLIAQVQKTLNVQNGKIDINIADAIEKLKNQKIPVDIVQVIESLGQIKVVDPIEKFHKSKLEEQVSQAVNTGNAMIRNARNINNMVQNLPSFITDNLNPSSNSSGGHFDKVIDVLISFLNSSRLSQVEKDYLDNVIPDLVEKLAKAESLIEVITIIEPIFNYNLAMGLNDTSKSPLVTASKDMVAALMDTIPSMDPELQGIVLQFFDSLIEYGSIQDSLKGLEQKLMDLFSDRAAEELKMLISQYMPNFTPYVQNATKLEDIFIVFGQYAETYLKELFNNLQSWNITNTRPMIQEVNDPVILSQVNLIKDQQMKNLIDPKPTVGERIDSVIV